MMSGNIPGFYHTHGALALLPQPWRPYFELNGFRTCNMCYVLPFQCIMWAVPLFCISDSEGNWGIWGYEACSVNLTSLSFLPHPFVRNPLSFSVFCQVIGLFLFRWWIEWFVNCFYAHSNELRSFRLTIHFWEVKKLVEFPIGTVLDNLLK